MRPPRTRGITSALVGLALLTACAGSAPEPGADPGDPVDLVGPGCPDVIRIAADGIEPERLTHLTVLVGEGGADALSGPLVADGVPTGVDIEILTGGDVAPVERISDDRSIFLGVVDAEDAIRHSGEHPVVGVFAPFTASALASDRHPDYPGMIVLLPHNVDDYVECLAVLVPILQRAAHATSTFAGEGDVDSALLDALIERVTDAAADDFGARVAPGLTADELFSAAFLDPDA